MHCETALALKTYETIQANVTWHECVLHFHKKHRAKSLLLCYNRHRTKRPPNKSRKRLSFYRTGSKDLKKIGRLTLYQS